MAFLKEIMAREESETKKIIRLIIEHLKKRRITKDDLNYFEEHESFSPKASKEIAIELKAASPKKILQAIEKIPTGYTEDNISRDYFLAQPMEIYQRPNRSFESFELQNLQELGQDEVEKFLTMQSEILKYGSKNPLYCPEKLLRQVIKEETGKLLGILGEDGTLLGSMILTWFNLDEKYIRTYLGLKKSDERKIIRIQKLVAQPGHEHLKEKLFAEACNYAFHLDAACIYGYFGGINGKLKRKILLEEGCKNTTKRSLRQSKEERVLFIVK